MSSIWYRLYSEKNWSDFSFPNKVIQIGDIKQEIIKRKNMSKAPEEFVFLFYDENGKYLPEDFKVEPMKRLIIKRFPSYKFSHDFVPVVSDPREILKKSNERGELQQTVRYYEPLEKIANKLSLEMINKIFKCKLCIKTDIETLTNYNPIITFCCKETICLDCYNKNENNICPFCKNQKKGYVPNVSEKQLRIKLLDILEKKRIEKEKAAKMLEAARAEMTPTKDTRNYMNNNIYKELYNKNNNILNDNKNNLNNGINYSSLKQRNIINNNIIDGNNNPGLNNILYNNGNNIIDNNNGNIINNNQYSDNKKDQNNNIQNSILQNPSLPLIQDARFFIIKSTNKENIEKSQKNSIWATTIPNQKKLNDAFSKNKVILIFSANGTQSFQGYGIMTSYSSDRPSNNWQVENHIKLGGDFTVIWLCFCSLSFSKIKNLQNPKNNGDLVIKSRDSTELSPEVGFQLCKLCYEQEKNDINNNNQQNKITSQLIEKINEDIKNNRNKQQQKKTTQINNNINNSNNINNNNNISNNQPNNVNYEKTETQNINNMVPPNIAPTQPMMPYYYPFPYYWKMMPMMTDQSQQQVQMVNEQGIPMMPNNMFNNNLMMNNQMNKDGNNKDNNDNKDKKDKEKKEHKKHHHSDYHSKRDDRKRNRSRRAKRDSRSRSRDRSRRSESQRTRSDRKSHYSKSYK